MTRSLKQAARCVVKVNAQRARGSLWSAACIAISAHQTRERGLFTLNKFEARRACLLGCFLSLAGPTQPRTAN